MTSAQYRVVRSLRIAPRNPVARNLHAHRGGRHGKSRKAQRRADKVALKRDPMAL